VPDVRLGGGLRRSVDVDVEDVSASRSWRNADPPTVSFGIIGGTGAYNDARGELTGVPEPAVRIAVDIYLAL